MNILFGLSLSQPEYVQSRHALRLKQISAQAQVSCVSPGSGH